MVTRHGARFPTTKTLSKLDKLSAVVRGNWTAPYSLIDEGLLTSHGVQEMKALGRRVKQWLPELFSTKEEGGEASQKQVYHPRRTLVQSSKKTRALQSASAFTSELFPNAAVAVHTEDEDRDLHLRFHDNCERYAAHKKRVRVPVDEDALRVVTKRVSDRLKSLGRLHSPIGGAEPTSLHVKHVLTMWSTCRFEVGALGLPHEASTCALFDESDAETLEYAADVEDYWVKAYGHAINYEMACVLMTDIVRFLQDAAGAESPRDRVFARLLFGHAENVMPLVSYLGLYRDETPLGAKASRERKWRSSVVTPFSANLAFVLDECGDDVQLDKESSSSGVRWFVRIAHNERELDISHVC